MPGHDVVSESIGRGLSAAINDPRCNAVVPPASREGNVAAPVLPSAAEVRMLERRDLAPRRAGERGNPVVPEAWHVADAAVGPDRKLSAAEVGMLERYA